MEAVDDLAELLERIDRCLRIRQVDIAAGAALLNQFYFAPPAAMMQRIGAAAPGSLHSYYLQMAEIYAPIANRVHSLDLEGHDTLSPGEPWPFNQAPVQAGYWLTAYGYTMAQMALEKGARVLEVGFGAGGLTEQMIRSGLSVTGVEVRESNCQMLRDRALRLGHPVTVLKGDIADLPLDGPYDAIVFFESFHHMSAPTSVLARLTRQLAPDGMLVFAAEPIQPAGPLIPLPWGFRMDGASLGALREVGWVEFGFQEDFFHRMLADTGFAAERRFIPGITHCDVWIGRRAGPAQLELRSSR